MKMMMNDFKLHDDAASNDGENYQSIDLFLFFAELSRCRQMIQRRGVFFFWKKIWKVRIWGKSIGFWGSKDDGVAWCMMDDHPETPGTATSPNEKNQ